MAKRLLHRYPGRVILASFLLTIMTGTLFLALPICQATPTKFFDIFFSVCSATTVTGLLTVPITNFTTIGHIVILTLMQIGGLGLITMLLFFVSMFVDIGLTTQLMAGEILEVDSIKTIRHLIKFIIATTLTCETLGAFLTFIAIYKKLPLSEAIFKSIFHSVSAFCNVGITLFPNGMTDFVHNPLMLINTALLGFLGGFGFLALYQIVQYFLHPKHPRKLNLHTYIVLWMSVAIIVVGCSLFWILEHNNTLSSMNMTSQWLNALYNTMCSRSTGALSININNLQLATIFMIMCIAFVGSSPGSTGSGIKTTTFAILLATTKAAITGKDSIHIRQRKLKKIQIYRALAIVMVALFWIAIVTFLLLITEKNLPFLDIFFETISSFSVLGITTGITPLLSNMGKTFIIATMIAGRIGSLTLILAFAKTKNDKDFSYPEERVMLS